MRLNRLKTGARRISGAVVWICLLLCLLELVVLQANTTFSTDDYFYAGFCKGGAASFIRANIRHYKLLNGRVLVHLAAELLLAAGTPFFAPVNTAVLCAAWLFLQQLQQEDGETGGATGLLLFLFDFLFAGYKLLSSSLLSVADACNYILPVFLTGAALVSLKAPRRSKGAAVLSLLPAFLAGASTELGAICCALLLFLRCADSLRSGTFRQNRRYAAALLSTAAGAATILLSPATRSRVAAEFSLGRMPTVFRQMAVHYVSPGSHLCLMLLVCISTALYLFLTRKKVLLPAAGAALAAALSVCAFFPPHAFRYAVLFFCFCAYVIAVGLVFTLRGKEKTTGHLLLTAIALVLVMLFTDTPVSRVTVPTALLLSSAVSFLAVRSIAALPPAVRRGCPPVLALLALGAVLLHGNMIRGILDNRAVMKRNDLAAQEAAVTGVLAYEDYNDRYAECPMFSSGMFERDYLAYHDIPGATVLCHFQPFREGGSRCLRKDGETYIALRDWADRYGGGIFWSDGYLEITLDQRYTYLSPYLYTERGGKNVRYDIGDELLLFEGVTYLSPRVQAILASGAAEGA